MYLSSLSLNVVLKGKLKTCLDNLSVIGSFKFFNFHKLFVCVVESDSESSS